MQFADALEQGLTEFGMPDQVITTLVSKLFIFGVKVYKVYKHEKFFFADLLTFESRKVFCTEDFFWNNTAAPEIYLHLWGVEESGGVFTLVPPSFGQDFVIEMSKIDDSMTLTKLLVRGELNSGHMQAFVGTLVDTLATLTQERRTMLADLFNKPLTQITTENADSLHSWMLGESQVPAQDAEEMSALLARAANTDPYFSSPTGVKYLRASIDNNCDNLLLLNGHPSFIDIMPPMYIWRVVDEYATISRFIVDVEVLGGEELGQAARAAYSAHGRDLPPVARVAHELRAACIQWPYRYILKQNDLAEKFGVYAKAKAAELQRLLG